MWHEIRITLATVRQYFVPVPLADVSVCLFFALFLELLTKSVYNVYFPIIALNAALHILTPFL